MSTHVKSTNDEEVGVGAWPQGATEMRGGKKGDILKLVRQHLHYVRSQLLLLHASLSALALRTFPATAVACKSVIFLASPSFMQGMLILCLAVGKMDINYPPSSFPMELPDTLKDFLAK